MSFERGRSIREVVTTSLVSDIFRSKAEKVFRPWWDTVEDYLLNSLVLLGEEHVKLVHENVVLVIPF